MNAGVCSRAWRLQLCVWHLALCVLRFLLTPLVASLCKLQPEVSAGHLVGMRVSGQFQNLAPAQAAWRC